MKLEDVDTVYANVDLESCAFTQPFRKVCRIPHHFAHAAATFYTSPFPKATIVVIDGNGCQITKSESEPTFETYSIGVGDGNDIALELFHKGQRRLSSGSWQYICENSLGGFYKVITDCLGFGTRGQGKTMGLAPYGDLCLLAEMREFVSISSEGRIEFDPLAGVYDWLCEKLSGNANPFQVRANLAAAAQCLFEESLLKTLNHAYRITRIPVLCYGGGCALNSAANRRIIDETPFEDVFIFPAAGDGGLAIGAALYGYYQKQGGPRVITERSATCALAYTGRKYSDEDVLAALQKFPVYYSLSSDVCSRVAAELANGRVVAWFQGCSEIGPRALGNRSILGNPSSVAMRDHINLHIKFRESFRPLAPVVLADECKEYFETAQASPFMLTTARVCDEYRDRLAAVCHVDQTARLQTVDRPGNEKLYRLLECFKRRTGVPVLLNTSFNRKEEPIVETPEDALRAFIDTPIDFLAMHDYIIEKHTPWANRLIPQACSLQV